MSTINQDREFGNQFLDSITEFIGREFDVCHVFSDEKIISYCANMKPEDVFDEDVLGKWAESNGYVKEQ